MDNEGGAGEGLTDVVRRWLVETGYPLEMRVARVFRALDPLLLSQGGYYVDSRTGTIRETDIEVLWMQLSEHEVSLALHLIVECKTGDQPWILFSDPSAEEYIQVVYYGLAVAASAEPDDTALVDEIQQQLEHYGAPLFEGPSPVCFGAAQMKRQRAAKDAATPEHERDAAFDAIRQAASGAVGAVAELKPGSEPPSVHYAVPIVVTTHPLFLASLDDRGKPVVEATGRGCVHVRPSGSDDNILVHVVHEQELDEFIDVITRTVASFERVDPGGGRLGRPRRIVKRALRRLGRAQ